MIKKPKFGKIALVVFLTVLIWVWADLAQDQIYSLPSGRVTIAVAPSSDPATWIVFKRDANSPPELKVPLASVDLKGPVKTVAEVRRKQERGLLDLALYLDPKQEGLEADGSHVLDVPTFLRQNDQIRQLGLTVEGSEPPKLTVQVRRLVEKPVPVQCVDENGSPLIAEVVDPAVVKAFVPADEVPPAKIHLSSTDQQLARTTVIQKTPFVELAPGQTREVPTRVKIKLPSQETVLKEYTVSATLGFCFSTNLQGKYQVVLQNEADFANVSIQATPAAKDEFEKQKFPIILNILDTDKQATDFQDRAVEFNFPQECLVRGEIKEGHTPLRKAKFKVVPVSADNKPAVPK